MKKYQAGPDFMTLTERLYFQSYSVYDEVTGGLNLMLLEAQKCVAPLCEGLWEDAPAPMISRISTQFDPLPCTTELAAEYYRILALRPQRILVNYS